MLITTRPAPTDAATADVRSHVLHAETDGGSCDGDVVLLELPPGRTHTVPIGARESGSTLLAGAAEVLLDGVARPLDVGAIVQTAGGADLRLRTTVRPATLLSIYGAAGESSSDRGCTVRTAALDDAVEVGLHDPQRGFFHMHARMMIDQAHGGAGGITLGLATFAPGGGHALHRHPHAAEVFYLSSGDGVHLSEDGAEYPLHAGDLAYVAAGEWHGFRNTAATPARAVFGYLGANSLDTAGYELPMVEAG